MTWGHHEACSFFGHVRDDLGHIRLHHLVAARVIGMVVRVDQEVDLPRALWRHAFQEHRRGIRELAVDDDEGIGRDEVADGAAPRGENADSLARDVLNVTLRGLQSGVALESTYIDCPLDDAEADQKVS